MNFPYGESVVIVRSLGADAYGDPITGTPARIDLPGCAVAPNQSSEPTDRGRLGVNVGLLLILPPDSGLLHTDQVEVRGLLYDVDGGDAFDLHSPFTGWEPGSSVALRRAVG